MSRLIHTAKIVTWTRSPGVKRHITCNCFVLEPFLLTFGSLEPFQSHVGLFGGFICQPGSLSCRSSLLQITSSVARVSKNRQWGGSRSLFDYMRPRVSKKDLSLGVVRFLDCCTPDALPFLLIPLPAASGL